MTFKDQLLAAQRRLKKALAALALTHLFEERKRYDLAYDKAFAFAYKAEKFTLHKSLSRHETLHTSQFALPLPQKRDRVPARVQS